MVARLSTPARRASSEQNLLISLLAASAGPRAILLKRIKRIYDAVCPCDLSDPDLQMFVSTLYLAVRIFRPRVVIQTGTAAGVSTMALGLGIRDARRGCLFTIDPEPESYMGVVKPVQLAREAARQAGFSSEVTFVRGYSTLPLDSGRITLPNAPKWCLPRIAARAPADIVVVDGDHTFLGCYLDLVHGAAALAPDGPRVIICHDYLGILDVRRAVGSWTQLHKPRFERLIRSRCGIKVFQT